jgi:hypothetical protein
MWVALTHSNSTGLLWIEGFSSLLLVPWRFVYHFSVESSSDSYIQTLMYIIWILQPFNLIDCFSNTPLAADEVKQTINSIFLLALILQQFHKLLAFLA